MTFFRQGDRIQLAQAAARLPHLVPYIGHVGSIIHPFGTTVDQNTEEPLCGIQLTETGVQMWVSEEMIEKVSAH